MPKAEAAQPAENDESRLFIALVAVLIIVVAVFIYGLSLNRAPEAFTQTWLLQAPESAAVGSPAEFSFVIDSHEAAETAYSYSISSEGETKATGSLTLPSGMQETITKQISFKSASAAANEGKTRVLVEISKPGQETPYTLWFWVAVGP